MIIRSNIRASRSKPARNPGQADTTSGDNQSLYDTPEDEQATERDITPRPVDPSETAAIHLASDTSTPTGVRRRPDVSANASPRAPSHTRALQRHAGGHAR